MKVVKFKKNLYKQLLQLLISACCFFSCAEEKNTIINIQPLEDFTEIETTTVTDSIRRYFKDIVISKKIALPGNAFVKARNRYRADSLLRYLRDTRMPDTITVGLTHVDISTTKNGVQDWGVMGLGYMPGRACVISTHRLKNAT